MAAGTATLASKSQTFARKGHLKLTRWTIVGAIACVFLSVIFNYVVFQGTGSYGDSFLRSIALPAMLAVPLFAYMALKMRQLEVVNRELEDLASRDDLTASLNRGAFTAAVDRRVNNALAATHGALLVLDVDHFKRINDSYGHDQGDEALRLLASTIHASVRADDQIGRLGGEEFGVLLPGASLVDATEVAERIRRNVAAMDFRPNGVEHPLSVSVGGVAYRDQVNFADLFRLADKRLYEAKSEGRNRVKMMQLPAGFGQPATT